MKKNPELSIIIPFYNEEKNIPLVLNAYARLRSPKNNFELLCVNNGSTDNSKKIFVKKLSLKKYAFAKVINVKKNIGYGNGIMIGVMKAKGTVIAWTHADMQTDAQDVFRAYKAYVQAKNPQVVVKGIRVGRQLSSVLFSLGMAILSGLYLHKWFYEINAQPKLFHKSFTVHLKNAPKDFSLDLYFLYQCEKYGYTIKTIPVFFHKRIHGSSKWAYSFSSRLKTIERTVLYIKKLNNL